MADLPLETNNLTPLENKKKEAVKIEDFKFPIYGLDQKDFDPKELERLVRGAKSDVHTLTFRDKEGKSKTTEGRIDVHRKDDGSLGSRIYEKNEHKFELKDEISGVKFTDSQKEMLEKGNAILMKNLPSKDGGPDYNAWVQIDTKLNRMEMKGEKGFVLPREMMAQDISSFHDKLREKGEANVTGMTARNGSKFDATLKVNLVENKFDFQFAPRIASTQKEEKVAYQKPEPQEEEVKESAENSDIEDQAELDLAEEEEELQQEEAPRVRTRKSTKM